MNLPQGRENVAENRGPDKSQPIFLARETYRRRRLMDAARLLPFLAIVLFFLPTFWTPYLRTGGTASATVYLFVIWAGLILLAGILARALSAPDQKTGRDGP